MAKSRVTRTVQLTKRAVSNLKQPHNAAANRKKTATFVKGLRAKNKLSGLGSILKK